MTESTNIVEPTATSFQSDVMNSSVPVLVDFWAPWCPPCRMLKPIVTDVAEELAGKIKVAFINVDEQKELAERFNVSSIPALFVIKDGKVVDSFAGYAPKAALISRLTPLLNA